MQALDAALPDTADAFMDLVRRHALHPEGNCQAAGHLLYIAASCLVRHCSAARLTSMLRLALRTVRTCGRTGQMFQVGSQAMS